MDGPVGRMRGGPLLGIDRVLAHPGAARESTIQGSTGTNEFLFFVLSEKGSSSRGQKT